MAGAGQGHGGTQVFGHPRLSGPDAATGRLAEAALVDGPCLYPPLGPPGPGQPERGAAVVHAVQGDDDRPGLARFRCPARQRQAGTVVHQKGPSLYGRA